MATFLMLLTINVIAMRRMDKNPNLTNLIMILIAWIITFIHSSFFGYLINVFHKLF